MVKKILLVFLGILLLVGVVSALPSSVEITYPENDSYDNNVTNINWDFGGILNDTTDFCWYKLNSDDWQNFDCDDDPVIGITSEEGDNTWELKVNDSIGNTQVDTVDFWVDSIAPVLINLGSSLKYTNGNTLNLGVNLFEVNKGGYFGDGTPDGSSNFIWRIFEYPGGGLERNSFPLDASNDSDCSTIPSTLEEGNYSYTVKARDQYPNGTTIRELSLSGIIIRDTVPPLYSNPQNSSNIYGESKIYNFNITWTDSTSWINETLFLFEGDIKSVTNSSDIYFSSVSDLSAGSYNYSWNATDMAGNENTTDNLTFIVDKATPVLNFMINTTWDSEVYGMTTNVSGNTTNQIINNCSLYRDNNLVSNPDVQKLGVKTYNYTFNCTETQNYTSANVNGTLAINPSQSSCEVLFNETSPVTYPASFIVYTDCDTTYTLYRNGTSIANGSEQTLGAGTYNFSVIRTDQQNYSNVYDEEEFVVEKANPETGMIINSNGSIVYGNPANVTGNETNNNDGGCNYTLYANDTWIPSNWDNSVYGYGTVNYVYNTSGCANYTAGSVNDSLAITKALQDAQLFINDTDMNYGEAVLVTCNGTLYRDEEDVSAENGTAVVLGAGIYNYTCTLEETANLSEDSESLNVTVNKLASSVELYLNGNHSNISIEYQEFFLIQGNVTSDIGSEEGQAQLWVDGSLITPVNKSQPNVSTYTFMLAGTYNITVTYESQNYSASSDTLFVDVAERVISSSSGGSSCKSKYNCTLWSAWSVCVDGEQFRTCLEREKVRCGEGNTTLQLDMGETQDCVPYVVEDVEEELGQEGEPIIITEEPSQGAPITGGVVGFLKSGTGIITIITLLVLAGAYGVVHYRRTH